MNRQAAAQTQVTGGDPGQAPEEELVEFVDETEQRGQAQPGQQVAVVPPGEEDDDDEPVGQQAGAGEGGQQAIGEEGQQEGMTPRQRRRARERQRMSMERAELFRLREDNTRLMQLVQRTDARIANVELTGLDSQIAGVEAEINRAGIIMQSAMKAQNTEDFMKAMEIRDVLRDRLNKLQFAKQSAQGQPPGAAQGGQAPVSDGGGQPAGPPQVSPEQRHFAGIFVSRHPWFTLGGRDPDSQTVQMLDEQLTREGGNPRTPEYWMELERRIAEELPHRTQPMNNNGANGQGGDAGQQSQQQGAGRQNGAAGGPKLPGSGNRGGASGAAPGKFHLSAARKQALIDLGVWDNPTERNKHIRAFMRWDQEHGAQQ